MSNLPGALLALWAVFGNVISLVADLAGTGLAWLLTLLGTVANTMTCKV
jgi:hypothetical protein